MRKQRPSQSTQSVNQIYGALVPGSSRHNVCVMFRSYKVAGGCLTVNPVVKALESF